jgi:hypothetical protein
VRRQATLILAALAICVATAGATAAPSPQKLYTRLLTTPFPDSQLPQGFTSAKVGYVRPNSQALKYHIVGEVAVMVTGPDAVDGIIFEIFPTAADARSDLANPALKGDEHLIGRVPGYALPGDMIAGSVSGNNASGKPVTNGITYVSVAQANVLVAGVSVSADNTESGNVPAALALLRSALKHLQMVSS